MIPSSTGNIFRVTGPLCGEFTGPGEFPTQRPVRLNFDVFVDLRLNKRLRKQRRGWWFETPSCPLWRHCNENSFLYQSIFFYVWIRSDMIWQNTTSVQTLSHPFQRVAHRFMVKHKKCTCLNAHYIPFDTFCWHFQETPQTWVISIYKLTRTGFVNIHLQMTCLPAKDSLPLCGLCRPRKQLV